MNMIAKLFKDFRDTPAEEFKVAGSTGTGPFARPINDSHPHMQKIILSGDAKQTVAIILWYVLHDLAVDLGWPREDIDKLARQFSRDEL